MSKNSKFRQNKKWGNNFDMALMEEEQLKPKYSILTLNRCHFTEMFKNS